MCCVMPEGLLLQRFFPKGMFWWSQMASTVWRCTISSMPSRSEWEASLRGRTSKLPLRLRAEAWLRRRGQQHLQKRASI